MNGYSRTDLNNKYKNLFFILATFLLLVVGLRADVIGIDTLNYKHTYLMMGNESFSLLNNYQWYEEIGYAFVNILFNKLAFPW